MNGNLAYHEERRQELIGGEIVMMSPASTCHTYVADKIFYIFKNYLKGKQSGRYLCRFVLSAETPRRPFTARGVLLLFIPVYTHSAAVLRPAYRSIFPRYVLNTSTPPDPLSFPPGAARSETVPKPGPVGPA